MGVAAVTTVGAALMMGGSAVAADTDDAPSCPAGYLPAIGQADPQSTVCITAGPSANGDIHAIVRIDPALCAHVAVGDNRRSDGATPNDVVRTLRCPRPVPPVAVVPTEPTTPGTGTGSDSGSSTGSLPTAPAPTIVGSHLPVTH